MYNPKRSRCHPDDRDGNQLLNVSKSSANAFVWPPLVDDGTRIGEVTPASIQ
ncbi:MAG: hypothetical protein ACI8RE_002028 [Ilumatobacter sp.]|jgi:hypothetical protein